MGETRSAERTDPFTLNHVLAKEYSELRPAQAASFVQSKSSPPGQEVVREPKSLSDIFTAAHALGAEPQGGQGPGPDALSAICLSGGGIRSATFNLGILQSLARSGLLGKFDYLSSVSGGGYIASWLRTWMAREGSGKVLDELAGSAVGVETKGQQARDPLRPEPAPIRKLRQFSNYLTPRLGLFSGDTWAAASIVVRNLLLNWTVIVPVIAAVISLPLAFLLFVKSANPAGDLGPFLLYAALAVELFASTTVHVFRRSLKNRQLPQTFYIFACAVPIWIAATLLCWAALELELPWVESGATTTTEDVRQLWQFALLWCVGIPVVGWAFSLIGSAAATSWRRSWVFDLLALIGSGLLPAWLLVEITENLLPSLHTRPDLFVVFAVPLLLSLYLVARTLFIALTSAREGIKSCAKDVSAEDVDREWWARLSGWLLLFVVTWVIVTGLVFIGGFLLQDLKDFAGSIEAAVGGVGGLAGAVAAYIAKSDKTPAKMEGEREVSLPRRLLLALAAPLFIACVIIVVTWGAMWLGEIVAGLAHHGADMKGVFDVGPCPRALPVELSVFAGWWIIGMSLALGGVALLFGMVVNVNRYSLHAMYRNRLVRAYLGASNTNRKPDSFTGFDPNDNLKLCELWHERAKQPLPIINTTLNLSQGGKDLAWQERKAESFSMTPFFCGNYLEGYRVSHAYGSPTGISVGTAVTISGAAANSNMGYASGPALSFLMTLFNARLGAWLGNTGKTGTGRWGQKYYSRPGPGQALRPLINELLGRTSNEGRYVNLSDGGHFDNLGLYEVVLRRCRHILVCDAGQDDSFGFSDLGNAIRKVRIDFGIPIEFRHRIQILPKKASAGAVGYLCATATIRYKEIDGKNAPDGTIVYIKPTLYGPKGWQVPYDVYSYSHVSSLFPHESTADQWFSESQFESYRALGEHIFRTLSPRIDETGVPVRDTSIEGFVERMKEEIKAAADGAS